MFSGKTAWRREGSEKKVWDRGFGNDGITLSFSAGVFKEATWGKNGSKMLYLNIHRGGERAGRLYWRVDRTKVLLHAPAP